MDIEKQIKKEYQDSTDLKIKKLYNTTVIYLESLCSSDAINEYVLKVLALNKDKHNIENNLVGPNTKIITKYQDIFSSLNDGFTIVINKKIYAIETKGKLIRSVSEPSYEQAIYAPKDSFNESILTNLGLIKRRIKTPSLINIDYNMGKQTKTKVSLLYMDNIAKKELINMIKDKLNKIDIDGIIDAGNISQLLATSKTPLPTIFKTERPDTVVTNLLEGKIIILVDNSPFALVLPSFFTDFINPTVDQYSKSININFLKFLRLICLFITLFAPALYISVINYNQESIPIQLLVSFTTQRTEVPFPAYIEAIFMLILCGILRESDLRFPSSYGSSISIVGALVLGEAAVNAGIVSPIMIIVIALVFITSMIFTDMELINSLRLFRFMFLFLACFFGIYGFYIGLFYFLIHLSSITVLNIPYTYPIAPFDLTYIKKTLFRSPKNKDKKRSKKLTNINITKQGD